MTSHLRPVMVTIACISASVASVAAAAAPNGGAALNVHEGEQQGNITYKLKGSTAGSAAGSAPAPATTTTPTTTAATATPTPAAQQVVTDPSPLVSASQITSCYQGIYTYVDSVGQTVMGFAGSFSCPKVPTPTPAKPSPAASAPAPSAVAATVWEQDGANQLPSPHPYIAPGYALAGLRGYLEVRAPLSASFSDPTRLGTLTIAATAKVWVNWGDGVSNDGPYESAGAPYPNGTITHYWDYDGTYDIVVDEDWTATWTLAGASGTLTGLQTEGTIPNFRVNQVESVRNY